MQYICTSHFSMESNDTKRYSLEELKQLRQSGQSETKPNAPEIELDATFWENAKVTLPVQTKKTSVHLRLDSDVVDFFREQGKGHVSRMQAVLKAYADAHQPPDNTNHPSN
jgi:uncharacterized protein (DUF4415 family)